MGTKICPGQSPIAEVHLSRQHKSKGMKAGIFLTEHVYFQFSVTGFIWVINQQQLKTNFITDFCGAHHPKKCSLLRH